MKIISDYQNCSETAKDSVVAIGNFDGVHKGHIAVIEKTKEISRKNSKQSGVLTFEPHPVTLFYPEKKHFRITNINHKAELLQKLGINNLFIIPFDKQFSEITAEDFIKQILVEHIRAAHIVTGNNFSFGYKREGNVALLKKYSKKYKFGYTSVMPIGNEEQIFSSTLVRNYITQGDLVKARGILGRNFSIYGKVAEGNKKGRQIGFPTINIYLGDYIRPAFGVYAAVVYVEGKKWPVYGAANVGIRPTIGGNEEVLEVHLFDFNENIYGLEVEVELIEYIRPEKYFSNMEELKQQIVEDCSYIRTMLMDKS